MTVKQFAQPDYPSQSGTQYPANIDAAIAVLAEIGAAFAAHEQATPDMTVRVDAGRLSIGSNVLHVAAQDTATITAPTTNPRIDRIVLNVDSGAVSVIAGAEAASPTAPAITDGFQAVAQVLLQTSSASITNAMLTDERAPLSPKISTYIRTLLDDATAAAARTTLGLGALAVLNSVPNGSLDGPALGFLLRADVANRNTGSVAMPDTVTTVDLGSVVAGDRIMVTGIALTAGAVTPGSIRCAKDSGTATIIIADTAASLYAPWPINEWGNVSGIIKVTGSGTLVLKLYGVTIDGSVATNFGQLHAMVLKGG